MTDSRAPGEPKDVEGSALFQMYQAFATPAETEAMRQAYADGISWGDAKQKLYECIDREIAPMRAKYEDLMAHPEKVEAALQAGAERARALSRPLLQRLRTAVGLRTLTGMTQSTAKVAKADKAALPVFKQYREKDGQFYFKLTTAGGQVLLQSTGFAQPREAGQHIARLQQEGVAALDAVRSHLQPLDGVQDADITAALQQLHDAAQAE